MKRSVLISILLAMAAVSCSNGTDPGSVSDLRVRAFKRGETKFTADADSAVTDRLVTLTLRCVPAVSGKGIMVIKEYGNVVGYWTVVESPGTDTLRPNNPDKVDGLSNILHVDFVAGDPIERSWKIRFPITPWHATFTFSANVNLDSVYVQEYSKWFSVESDTAKSYTPNEVGYNRSDTDNNLHFSE
jgi:hypothetical protein